MTAVLPIYLAVDTSASMGPVIDTLNRGLTTLIDSLLSDPIAADTILIGIIEFSGEAREVLPLTYLRDIGAAPLLEVGTVTNYGSAFMLLRQLITRDVARLRRAGLRIFRPIAVFMTDGNPTDSSGRIADSSGRIADSSSWHAAFREIQDPKFQERPTIIAIGFGSADPGVLREIGAGKGGRAFFISENIGARSAVESIYSGLAPIAESIVRSSVSTKSPTLPVQLPNGWIDLSSIPELP